MKLIKKEWYLKRDSRTNLLAEITGIENYKIGVVVEDANILQLEALDLLVKLTLNLLFRWCRNLILDLFDNNNDNLNINNYRKSLKESLKKIDPFGKIQFGKVMPDLVDSIIVIGNSTKKFNKPSVFINSEGWISSIAFNFQGNTQERKFVNRKNVLGASFAACLGNAQLFRIAMKDFPKDFYNHSYSLFDFSGPNMESRELDNPDWIDDVELGVVAQIGCGAVGSSLDYLLSKTDIKASLYLVDFDSLDYSNCNRSPIFNPGEFGNAKVSICNELFKNSNISCIPIVGDYDDFVKKNNSLEIDILLSLANERNVWDKIQNNYPPLTFHASTTPNWSINVGRHIPLKDWCILCRFQNNINHGFVPKCSEVEISNISKNDSTLGVLPFFSMLSATILFTTIMRNIQLNYLENKNFIIFNAKKEGGRFIRQIKRKRLCYVCSNQNFEIFSVLRNQSKYWYMSES